MSFKSFQEWQDEQPMQVEAPQKKWKATKDEIIQFWTNLRADTPIAIDPISYDHKGSTYKQDGVRITGSKEFIATTLARLKEFLGFEGTSSKLMLVWRETERQQSPEDKPTYVFYVQVKERGQAKTPGQPPAAIPGSPPISQAPIAP